MKGKLILPIESIMIDEYTQDMQVSELERTPDTDYARAEKNKND